MEKEVVGSKAPSKVLAKTINKTGKGLKPKTNGTNVFSYLNYRDYLKDFYELKKEQNPAFSFASFALRAKINTPNYLKRVIDGERPLNAESIPKFCFGLGLSSKESIYFEALVNFNQSKDEDVRKHYWGIMRKASEDVPGSVIEVLGNQFEVFNHWYILPVRELALLKNFSESPAQIVRMMKNKITKKEAKFAIQTLLKLEMLKRDENGKLYQAQPIVRYSQEVVNLTIREFHRQMLARTNESLTEDEFGTWNVRALSLAIKKSDFPVIHQKITNFIYQLNKEYSVTGESEKKDKDVVIQINCQMVQLSDAESVIKYERAKYEKQDDKKGEGHSGAK